MTVLISDGDRCVAWRAMSPRPECPQSLREGEALIHTHGQVGEAHEKVQDELVDRLL